MLQIFRGSYLQKPRCSFKWISHGKKSWGRWTGCLTLSEQLLNQVKKKPQRTLQLFKMSITCKILIKCGTFNPWFQSALMTRNICSTFDTLAKQCESDTVVVILLLLVLLLSSSSSSSFSSVHSFGTKVSTSFAVFRVGGSCHRVSVMLPSHNLGYKKYIYIQLTYSVKVLTDL